jgi:lipopolysaccharide export system protein LptA
MAIDKLAVLAIMDAAKLQVEALPDVGDQSAQIAALQAQVAQLESDKVVLQSEVVALQSQLAEKVALLAQVDLAAKAIDASIPD